MLRIIITMTNVLPFKGLIIGWIHLILQVLVVLFCAAFLTIYDCSDFEKLIGTTEDRICFFERGKQINIFKETVNGLPNFF